MSESFDRHDVPRSGRESGLDEAIRARVLIVDDDAASRLVCANYCDLFDHISHSVRGAGEAVSALRRERFDVVVLSVHMHGGLDALRAIRALPTPASAAPIIGLAAVDRGDESQRWLAAGLAAVLAKPVTARRLFHALGAALEGDAGGRRSWAPAG